LASRSPTISVARLRVGQPRIGIERVLNGAQASRNRKSEAASLAASTFWLPARAACEDTVPSSNELFVAATLCLSNSRALLPTSDTATLCAVRGLLTRNPNPNPPPDPSCMRAVVDILRLRTAAEPAIARPLPFLSTFTRHTFSRNGVLARGACSGLLRCPHIRRNVFAPDDCCSRVPFLPDALAHPSWPRPLSLPPA
jgi:hypothetical protein